MKASTRMFLAAYREKYRIKRDIDETNLEILKVVQDMKGLSHHGVEMSPEQMRSSLPMPKTVSPSTGDERMLWLIERKDELEKKLDWLAYSLQQAEKASILSPEDQSMLHDLYHSRMTAEDVADKYGYHPKSMYRHIYGVLDMLL
ncbi:hypothetical protein [Faecalibaculum rodentium]|uniref:hypothetical protein n=1 Tax=Faecalibaculum rodentium TaxID=1702221 RepID=UPI0025A16B9A|nr:hypothetical protein [Faecalibaculum rodentium]